MTKIDPGNLTLRMPRELVSPNRWQGRHWRIKHRISQEWEQEIGVALLTQFRVGGGIPNTFNAFGAFTGPKKWIGYEAPKIRVSVTREVPSGRNFIRDDDNLLFSLKPVLDALKRQGYIRNDSRKWIELDTPLQRMSSDGQYWTVVTLSRVVEQTRTKQHVGAARQSA